MSYQHRVISGIGLFLAIVGCVVFGPLLYPVPASTINLSQANHPPTWEHPFGLNDLGQDMLARVLAGGRISLTVGIGSTAIALLLGTLVGVLASVGGSVADGLLMRLTDLFLSLPHLPLLLLILFLFQESATRFLGTDYGIFLLVVLVIGLLSWMPIARLVRAGVLTIREMDFITAAWMIGASPLRVVLFHILPNVINPVLVAATISVGSAIVTESTLSFLGLGFPPDTPTWGRMLYDARDYLDIAPHMALFPGLALFLTVLSIQTIGDGLQEQLDPRRR
jgi:peptide/nickel transport system permease protein